MKFKKKIILSFSSLISLAFAFMMLFIYVSISRSNQALIDTQSRQLFTSKANEAGGWLEQRIAELEVISLSPAVQSMDNVRILQFVETLNQFASSFKQSQLTSTQSQTIGNTVLYTTPIPNTNNWYLCTLVNQSTLMQTTHNLLHTLFIVWLMLLLSTIILSFILSNSITKPLAYLCETMDKAGQGNLSIQLNTNRNDEFNSLATSFNQIIAKIHQLMDQLMHNEKEKRKAELRTLQTQINPHFLYNTLDTIHWMAYDHNDNDMLQTIDALSQFYRISLSKGDEFIPLSKEIDHVKYYLQIQALRFDKQFEYIIHNDIHTNYLILKIILQPIVENAIIHGIKPCNHPCLLQITITQIDNSIQITINDNGIGMNKQQLNQLNQSLKTNTVTNGYGLINVNQRIRLTYGNAYGLHIESEVDQGTSVIVTVPAIEGDYYVENNNMR